MSNWNLEEEVPLLELCKKLEELGYPQEGDGLYWKTWNWTKWKDWENWDVNFVREENRQLLLSSTDFVRAPTCRELGEWLIKKSILLELGDLFIGYDESVDKWTVCYGKVDKEWVWADTEPDARAKMLIWLVENGYVRFDTQKN